MSSAHIDASAQSTAHGVTAFALWRAAVVPGLLFVAVATTAVVVSGRLPEGTATWVVLGAVLASITGPLGVFAKCRAILAPVGGPGSASSLQIALFGDFVLNLFAIGISMLVLFFFVGLKFPALAGFALAFAAVALCHQLLSAMVLARALKRRAASGTGSDGAPAASSNNRDPGQSPDSVTPSSAESGS